MSARSPVAVSEGESAAPGRKTGLRCSRLIAATTSSSRAQRRTGAPSAARSCASAVPQAPPPTTPKLRYDVMPSLRRRAPSRSEEHTSELQSLLRISYAVFCLKKKKIQTTRSKDFTYCSEAQAAKPRSSAPTSTLQQTHQ